jgi:hypothetical protein
MTYYAHCVECPCWFDSVHAENAERWATNHEKAVGKHSVKIEGYEDDSRT